MCWRILTTPVDPADDVGYRNLLALTTAAHLDGYYYKPRIDKELLARHSEGLIGTSACLGGEVL